MIARNAIETACTSDTKPHIFIDKGVIFVNLQDALSANLSALKRSRGQTTAELAEDLGVSRSNLQKMLNKQANPTIDTIQYMVEQIEADPLMLLFGDYSGKQHVLMLHLLQSMVLVSDLGPGQRRRLAELIQQIISLFGEENE